MSLLFLLRVTILKVNVRTNSETQTKYEICAVTNNLK